MKAALLPLLLGMAACGHGGATAVKAQVTPLQKVVQMLEGMLTTAKKEKHEEALQFAGFEQFCSDVTRQKTKDIEEADEQIGLLKAHIMASDTEAVRLSIEVQNHVVEMGQMEKDSEAAKTVRHMEREEYLAMHQNYTESLHALSKAIMTMKAQDYDRKGVDGGAAAMLQKVQSSVAMPQKQGRALQAFLELVNSEEPDLTFAPEGGAPSVPTTAYKFRSNDIVDMLSELEVRFKDELHKLEADEVSREQAYNMLAQDLKGSTDAAEAQRTRKSSAEAKHRAAFNAASAELDELSTERADDDKYLTDLKATCDTKSKEFAAREKLRGEEISALEKAVEILGSDDVKGGEKHLPAAAIAKVIRVRKQALIQLRGRDEPNEELVSHAAQFLREASQRLHSHQLAALAVQAGADPFAKVKQLIEELIKRLMAEATGEAEHKGWCDTELSTNEHTRKSKTEEIDMLRSDIDGLTSGIAQLTKDLATLSTEISAIDAAVAEATDIRNNETAANNVTITEARAAQKAVADAVKVLKDFYAKAGKATVLAQGGVRQDPEAAPGGSREAPPVIFDSPYQGQQAESGGVLGMLEVIASDFARLEQDTIAEEETATAEYNGFMEDSSISKAQKESGVKSKEESKRQKEQTLSEKQESLGSAESVLTTAEDEFEKLKPACIDTGMTYEERVQARKDEIEALKQALDILSGQE